MHYISQFNGNLDFDAVLTCLSYLFRHNSIHICWAFHLFLSQHYAIFILVCHCTPTSLRTVVCIDSNRNTAAKRGHNNQDNCGKDGESLVMWKDFNWSTVITRERVKSLFQRKSLWFLQGLVDKLGEQKWNTFCV